MRFTFVILGFLFVLCAPVKAVELVAVDLASDEALIEAAEQLVQTTEETVETPAATTATPPQKESEIPVQLTPAPKAKEAGGLGWRLAISLAFVAVMGGVLYYATRRWARPKDLSAKGARIEMLHQFHMGPRRSLALIRVAGEVMLIGVTDHNVNMLKPITLIDDEIEGLMNKDFNNFLEDEFSIEDVKTALRG